MNKFDYYLEENNALKSMNHFEALQLNVQSIEDFLKLDEKNSTTHIQQLFLRYLNNNSNDIDKIALCFNRIREAYEFIEKEKKELISEREKLIDLADGLEIINNQAIASHHQTKPLNNILQEIVDNQYFHRFSTFDAIIDRETNFLMNIYDIAKKSKHANDWYAVYSAFKKSSDADCMYWKEKVALESLQFSAIKRYPLAMLTVVKIALQGFYIEVDESVKWGLHCLRFLKKNLDRFNLETQEIISKNIEEIVTYRAKSYPQIVNIFDDSINLQQQIIDYQDYRHKRGHNPKPGNYFICSMDILNEEQFFKTDAIEMEEYAIKNVIGKIRLMNNDDLDSILAMDKQIFPNELKYSKHHLISFFNKDYSFVSYHEKRETINGYIFLNRYQDNIFLIGNYGVSKEYQDFGIGKSLIEAAIKSLRNNFSGELDIVLKVRKTNARAKKIFQQNGFLNQGEEGDFDLMRLATVGLKEVLIQSMAVNDEKEENKNEEKHINFEENDSYNAQSMIPDACRKKIIADLSEQKKPKAAKPQNFFKEHKKKASERAGHKPFKPVTSPLNRFKR